MTETVTRDASRLQTARALLFDLDGVLTPTVDVHMRAWSRLFTAFLAERGAEAYSDDDYYLYIDGKPRVDGVRSLLASRGITLRTKGALRAMISRIFASIAPKSSGVKGSLRAKS